MENQPQIAGTKPCVLSLEVGETYYWCSCGRSANQPFCDGSHRGTGMQPEAFQVQENKRYALCTCKQSNNGVFCDGSHKQLKTSP